MVTKEYNKLKANKVPNVVISIHKHSLHRALSLFVGDCMIALGFMVLLFLMDRKMVRLNLHSSIEGIVP